MALAKFAQARSDTKPLRFGLLKMLRKSTRKSRLKRSRIGVDFCRVESVLANPEPLDRPRRSFPSVPGVGAVKFDAGKRPVK